MIYGNDPITYQSSCQVFVYGDKGFMYSINGDGFYKAWIQPGALTSLLQQLGVQSLEGYITKPHARLMRLALRHVGNVVIESHGKMAGHDMAWIKVTDKGDSHS